MQLFSRGGNCNGPHYSNALHVACGGAFYDWCFRCGYTSKHYYYFYVHRAHLECGQHKSIGQVFVLFVIAVAAAEAAVGLGIILAMYRNKETINIDEMNVLKW